MPSPRLVLLGGLCLAAACATPRDAEEAPAFDSVVARDGDTAHVTSRTDWRLLQAREDARRTFPEFVARFRSPPDGQRALSLKGRFAEPDSGGAPGDSVVEHLWLEPIAYDSGRIRGVIDNTPILLRRVSHRDTVTIDSSHVSDWYAVEHDTLVAGFSLRVFRLRMTTEERARSDSADGYIVLPDSLEFRRRGLARR